MQREIPAPGYVRISGKRPPPPEFGTHLYCQLRNGFCDPTPWPIATTRWIWDNTAGDVVAIRRVDEGPKAKEGRQANGSYE